MKTSLRITIGAAIALACVVLLAAAAPLVPQGTLVRCTDYSFYFGQDLVLVLTHTGLFKATDEGWRMLSLPSDGVEVKATPDGVIYFYDYHTHQIHRSIDGGETWVLTGETPSLGQLGEHIFPSPILDMVFMGVDDFPYMPYVKGVYKSTDGGATWEQVLEGGNGEWVAFSPDFVQDGTAFAALSEYHYSLGIWKTEDWGETWFPAYDGLCMGCFFGHYWVSVSPQFPQDQTAFTSDIGGLYKTTNGGASWFKIDELYNQGVVFSPNYARDQTLLMGNIGLGLYLSQDGGESWQQILDGEVRAWGIRRPSPFGPPPAHTPPACPHCVYLPLIGKDTGALEFWFVGKKEHLGDCYLYRSSDFGTTWEEVAVFEASHWFYLPVVSHNADTPGF